jgi:hypothetical protein
MWVYHAALGFSCSLMRKLYQPIPSLVQPLSCCCPLLAEPCPSCTTALGLRKHCFLSCLKAEGIKCARQLTNFAQLQMWLYGLTAAYLLQTPASASAPALHLWHFTELTGFAGLTSLQSLHSSTHRRQLSDLMVAVDVICHLVVPLFSFSSKFWVVSLPQGGSACHPLPASSRAGAHPWLRMLIFQQHVKMLYHKSQ